MRRINDDKLVTFDSLVAPLLERALATAAFLALAGVVVYCVWTPER